MNILSRNVNKSTSKDLGLSEMASIVKNAQQLAKKQITKHCNESDEREENDEDEISELSSSKVFNRRSFWKLLHIYIEVIMRFKDVLFSKKLDTNLDKEKAAANNKIAVNAEELIEKTSSEEVEAKPVCEKDSTIQSKGGGVSSCNFEQEIKQLSTNQGHDIDLEQFCKPKQEVL